MAEPTIFIPYSTICYLHYDLLLTSRFAPKLSENREGSPSPVPLFCVLDVVSYSGIGFPNNSKLAAAFEKGFYFAVQLTALALEETMMQ